LYFDAVVTDPKLLDNLDAQNRFSAARAASLAAFGLSEDSTAISESQRTWCRHQARDWLRAAFTSVAKNIPTSETWMRLRVQRTLMEWRADPDVASLRDPVALEKLSQSERQEYAVFWSDVDALLRRVKYPN
jgi:hypothetical protein